MDEAQTLGIEGGLSTQHKSKVISFLNRYHNLESDQGFILLFGGLGMTKEVLRNFGVSRFNSGCVRSLERINAKAEKPIIQDWIIKEFKARGDASHWIAQITKRTYGWPRHIISYCNVICQELQNVNQLTDERLNHVLNQGDSLKYRYYKQRCDGISHRHRHIIGKTIERLPQ
ncbi:MAG: hypothetical protein OXE77_06840 [Flavobacteriaceae bacterium]|nr:hypothetical protein [Flavobacteriaceae bacterium]MCY4267521.1 hypothetical protein [Flavobacteriaceae bacterium]MCY4299707.1 hypothetical protein [Flavobacteriaceae bacterium]